MRQCSVHVGEKRKDFDDLEDAERYVKEKVSKLHDIQCNKFGVNPHLLENCSLRKQLEIEQDVIRYQVITHKKTVTFDDYKTAKGYLNKKLADFHKRYCREKIDDVNDCVCVPGGMCAWHSDREFDDDHNLDECPIRDECYIDEI